jgi:acyl-CoA hydrolase
MFMAALTAFFTMVALDQNGIPIAVPPLEVITDEERNLFEEGQRRYLAHKQKRMERRTDG